MTFRTEDQVRNQAGITLGFIDAKGNNVETTDYLSGVGCIFRKNRALAPHERSAVPLGTDHCPVG